MTRLNTQLLDQLADDLTPVQPLHDRRVHIALMGLALVGILLVAATLGVRPDLLAGVPHPLVLVRAGLLLVLGGVAAATAAAMARPGVGRDGRGWMAALAMASVLPAAALALAVIDPAATFRAIWWPSAMTCLAVSLAAALGFSIPLVRHLRRGAPVTPERAGLVTGLAAGSLGVLTYSVHCPSNDIAYIGLWYGLAITIATLAARLVVPRLIRW